MTISPATIVEIAERGDSETLVAIVKTVMSNINERTKELRLQRRTMARLRNAFVETQTDRDRIFRIALDLKKLCEESGLGDKAANLINKRGGLSEHDVGGVGEMVIELE